jgi:hypothetical protein
MKGSIRRERLYVDEAGSTTKIEVVVEHGSVLVEFTYHYDGTENDPTSFYLDFDQASALISDLRLLLNIAEDE